MLVARNANNPAEGWDDGGLAKLPPGWRGVWLLTPQLLPGAAGLSFADKCWAASRLLVTLQAAFLLQRLLNQAGAESHRLGGEKEGRAAGGSLELAEGVGGWLLWLG